MAKVQGVDAERLLDGLNEAQARAVQTSVVMVKPGGTGRLMLAISARFAPLPPRRLRMSARPSLCPAPKLYTHLVIDLAFYAGKIGGLVHGVADAAEQSQAVQA